MTVFIYLMIVSKCVTDCTRIPLVYVCSYLLLRLLGENIFISVYKYKYIYICKCKYISETRETPDVVPDVLGKLCICILLCIIFTSNYTVKLVKYIYTF